MVVAVGACLAAPALLQCGEAAGQPAVHRPMASQRVVSLFEFDQLEPFELPRHWDMYRGEGPTPGAGDRRYPAWNTARLDQSAAYRGQGSVRLSTMGGSVCLRLDPGVIPVFPGTEYLVSARIRTHGVQHARAAVSARYLDKRTRPIAASEARSALVVSAEDEWHLAVVALPDAIPEAAYIQIDLELLQPEEHEPSRPPMLGAHHVWPQDLRGHAWFDDVAVVQLPRVRLATSSPVNIIEHPREPEISVQVRDLAGQALVSELLIQDAAGNIVASESRRMRTSAEMWVWQPALPRFGWYRAILELSSGGRSVGTTHVDFAWLPEKKPARPGARDAAAFGLVVDRLPPQQLRHLPALVDHSGAGSVTVPIWSAELKREQIARFAQELGQALAVLQMGGMQISFSLPRLPDELSHEAHLDAASTSPVFNVDESIWGPFLMPFLDRFGQSVRRWHLGEPGQVKVPDSQGVARLREVLTRLVPGPIVTLPWPGELARQSFSVDEMMVSLPYTMPADAAPAFAAMWNTPDSARASLLLEMMPQELVSRHDAAAAFARQAIMVWSTRQSEGDAGLDMLCRQPWVWGTELQAQPMPRVELPVWRTLSDYLGGRRVVGQFPGAPGVFCLILAPESPSRPGALVAWQDAPVDAAVINAFLGSGQVSTVDIYGNTRLVPLSDGPVHRITLSRDPVFIENVDVDLVRFLSSFEVNPERMQPGMGEHAATIHLFNPWRVHVQGRLTILEPGGLAGDAHSRDRSWRITPRAMEFAIAPGQPARLPIRMGFSPLEEHGPREMVAEVEFSGMPIPPVRVRGPLVIHLDDLELDLTYRLIRSGNEVDVVVEAIVTNRSPQAATLEVTGFAAGYPRARASISDLPPGASALRRFAFPAGGRLLKSGAVAVSVHNADTGARINRSVTIE